MPRIPSILTFATCLAAAGTSAFAQTPAFSRLEVAIAAVVPADLNNRIQKALCEGCFFVVMDGIYQ